MEHHSDGFSMCITMCLCSYFNCVYHGDCDQQPRDAPDTYTRLLNDAYACVFRQQKKKLLRDF